MERLTRQGLDGTTGRVINDLVQQAERDADDAVAQLLAQARNGGT
ncbi:hypothetical protein ACFU6S_01975 [Streptomyces sp. NPDC057456]